MKTTLFDTRDCTCGTHLNIYFTHQRLFPLPRPDEIQLRALSLFVIVYAVFAF